MAGDLLDETLLNFSEAAALPVFQHRPGGKKLNVATMWRWTRHGVLKDGEVVRLESIKAGGQRLVSKEAIERFVTRLAEKSDDRELPPVPQPKLSKRRLKEVEAAERRLAGAGV